MTSFFKSFVKGIIRDQDTFINTADTTAIVSLNQTTANSSSVFGVVAGVIGFTFWLGYMLVLMMR